MAKVSYFPSNYQAIYDFQSTRAYIDKYVKLLNLAIKKLYQAIYIDPPAITSVSHS